MHNDYRSYLDKVTPALNALIDELNKEFPDIGLKVYQDYSEENVTLFDRMALALYVELIHIKIHPFKKVS